MHGKKKTYLDLYAKFKNVNSLFVFDNKKNKISNCILVSFFDHAPSPECFHIRRIGRSYSPFEYLELHFTHTH